MFSSSWPNYDDKYLEKDSVKIAIQVNGKLRATIDVDKNIDKEKLIEMSKNHPNVMKFISDKEVVREIYVPNKIVNIVIK